MSRFKLAVFLAGVSASIISGCMTESDTESYQMDGSIYRIEVETTRGDVYLTGGASTEVQVESSLAWSGKRPDLNSEFRGGVLVLSSSCTSRNDMNCAIDIHVTVPTNVSAKIQTQSGDLHVKGLTDSVEFLSSEGRLFHD